MCVATPGTRRRLTKWRRREPRLRGVSRLSPGSEATWSERRNAACVVNLDTVTTFG